jgi:hypothetical protein
MSRTMPAQPRLYPRDWAEFSKNLRLDRVRGEQVIEIGAREPTRLAGSAVSASFELPYEKISRHHSSIASW